LAGIAVWRFNDRMSYKPRQESKSIKSDKSKEGYYHQSPCRLWSLEETSYLSNQSIAECARWLVRTESPMERLNTPPLSHPAHSQAYADCSSSRERTGAVPFRFTNVRNDFRVALVTGTRTHSAKLLSVVSTAVFS
jgi:hypothetical protein